MVALVPAGLVVIALITGGVVSGGGGGPVGSSGLMGEAVLKR